MNISNRISSFAHIAAAAIRRALACCFPCCCRVSNSDETPATAEAGSERRVSHTESAGSKGSVVSQLAGYNNDGFHQESEDDTQSPGQHSDLAELSPAPSPASSRVSTPEPLRNTPPPEPIIVPARAVLLGIGTQAGSQAAATSHPEEPDTSAQAHTSDSTSSPEASPVTQKPASASSTPSASPVPAPRRPLSQAQKSPPPVPPVRTDSLSPKPSTSKAALDKSPPPEPKENRLISVRSIPKARVTSAGVDGVDFKTQQQTLFAVTTEHKIIRKRQDPPRPQPIGTVMKAKVELGVEKKPKPLPPKPTPSEGMKDKIALFEPKPVKEEGDEESQSEADKKRQDSTAGSSGQGKKTA